MAALKLHGHDDLQDWTCMTSTIFHTSGTKATTFKRGRAGRSISVPLIFRMATVEDRKGVAPAKPSRHLWAKHVSPQI